MVYRLKCETELDGSCNSTSCVLVNGRTRLGSITFESYPGEYMERMFPFIGACHRDSTMILTDIKMSKRSLGKGIGRKMMCECLHMLKTNKVKYVVLSSVSARDPQKLLMYYRRLGFRLREPAQAGGMMLGVVDTMIKRCATLQNGSFSRMYSTRSRASDKKMGSRTHGRAPNRAHRRNDNGIAMTLQFVEDSEEEEE